MQITIGNARLELVEGDITEQGTDAIVNAANKRLLGGGGVDGAIHRAGGPSILAECRSLGGCETGDAKITTGGMLRPRFVVHAVGPVYGLEGHERSARLLASAYRRSLEIVSGKGLQSVAFPSISTGAYGYPVEAAARVALRTVIACLEGGAAPGVRLVRFVLYDRWTLKAYEGALGEILESRPGLGEAGGSDQCQ